MKKTDFRDEKTIRAERRAKQWRLGKFLSVVTFLIVAETAWETVQAHRPRYGQTNTINTTTINTTTISTTNITNVTNQTVNNNYKLTGGPGKGNIQYTDATIDVWRINLAYLRLQFQDVDTAIVDGMLLGHIDFFGDDDSADANEIAGQIEVTAVGTWTDGAEDGRMELSVGNDGVQNNDQLVLNADGSVTTSGLFTPDSMDAVPSGFPMTYRFNMPDPPTMQGNDTQWGLDPNTLAAMTVTKVEITLDADPTTELDMDLKFADAFIGLANATLIGAIDTTNGTSNITSFTDATVPANKCIYVEFGAAPDAATLQGIFVIYWDYD